MKHLVQYHNVEEQGYDFPFRRPTRRHAPPPDDYAEIGTNKSVDNLRGALVWCISGKDSPRKYWLRYAFLVDEVGTGEGGGGFRNFVRGRDRLIFDDPPRLPPVRLDVLPWFPAFRRSQGSFAFGLSTIRDEFVPHFLSFLPKGHGLFNNRATVAGLSQAHGEVHSETPAQTRHAHPSATRVLQAPNDPLATRVTTQSGRYVLNSHPRTRVDVSGDCVECELVSRPRWRLYRSQGGTVCLCSSCVELLQPL